MEYLSLLFPSTPRSDGHSRKPPIRRFHPRPLPEEILACIFTYASSPSLSRWVSVGQLSPFHRRASPMNISQVNRHWRQVALRLPDLWTNIYIWGLFPRSPQLLWLWIHRSQSAPLRISLCTIPFCRTAGPGDPTAHCHCSEPCPTHNDVRVTGILHLIVKCSSRWEQISLSICTNQPTPLLELSDDSFPKLQTVEFRSSPHPNMLKPDELIITRKTQERFWKAVGSSRELKTLYSLGPLPPYIPLNRLQRLELKNELKDISQVAKCKRLLRLEFHAPFPSQSTHLDLPALRHLKLFSDKKYKSLSSFTTPSLQSLHLIVGKPSHSLKHLESLLTRSSIKLKELTLDCSCWWGEGSDDLDDPKALLQFFTTASMGELQSLKMGGCPSPAPLVRFLSDPNKASLASLQHLSLHFPFWLGLPRFLDLVDLRRDSEDVQNLKSVELFVSPQHNFWVQNRPPGHVYDPPMTGIVHLPDCVVRILPLSFESGLIRMEEYDKFQ